MKYFLEKSTNEIYAYSLDGSQDDYIKEGLTAITDKEYADAMLEIQNSVLLNMTYEQKRCCEYPNFIDYLDGVVKGDATQIQKYIDACNAIKLKYPKP